MHEGCISPRRILRMVLGIALLGGSLLVVVINVAVHLGKLDLEPVLSGSMRPTFNPGDLVAGWSVPISSLHVGEVMAFVPPGKTKREMHRIVKMQTVKGKMMIWTRGDANHGHNDPWDPISFKSKQAYRLAAVIPTVGFITELPKGIILPVCLIIAGLVFLISTFKELRRKGSGKEPQEAVILQQQ